MSNSSIWPLDRALSGAIPLCQSGPVSIGNEGVLYIPQSSSITGAWLSDCLVSYTGHSWKAGVLSLCRDAFGVFYSLSQLGSQISELNTRYIFCNIKLFSHCWFQFWQIHLSLYIFWTHWYLVEEITVLIWDNTTFLKFYIFCHNQNNLPLRKNKTKINKKNKKTKTKNKTEQNKTKQTKIPDTSEQINK